MFKKIWNSPHSIEALMNELQQFVPPQGPQELSEEQLVKCAAVLKKLSESLNTKIYGNLDVHPDKIFTRTAYSLLSKLYQDSRIQRLFQNQENDYAAINFHLKGLRGHHDYDNLCRIYAEHKAFSESLEVALAEVQKYIPKEEGVLLQQIEKAQNWSKEFKGCLDNLKNAAHPNDKEVLALLNQHQELLTNIRNALKCTEGNEISTIHSLYQDRITLSNQEGFLLDIGVYQSRVSQLVERLKRNLGSQSDEIKKLFNQLDEQNNKLGRARENISSQANDDNDGSSGLKETIEIIQAQVLELSSAPNEAEQTHREGMLSFQDKAQALQEQNDALQKQLSEAHKEHENQLNALNKKLQSKIGHLETKLNAQNSDSEASQKLKELKKLLDCDEAGEESKIRQLRREAKLVEQYENHILEIGIYQSHLSLLLDELRNSDIGKSEEVQKLLKQLQTQQAKLQTSSNALGGNADHSRIAEDSKVAQLQSTLRTMQAHINELTTKLRSADQNLQFSRVEADKLANRLRGENNTLRLQVIGFQKELNTQQEQFTKERVQSSQELERKNTKIQELLQELEGFTEQKNVLKTMENELKKANAQYEEAREALGNALTEKAAANNQASEYKQEIETFSKSIRSKDAELENLRSKLEELSEGQEADKAKDSEIEKLNQQIEELKEKLQLEISKKDEVAFEHLKLIRESSKTDEKINQLHKELDQTEGEITNLKIQLRTLKNSKEKEGTILTQLREVLDCQETDEVIAVNKLKNKLTILPQYETYLDQVLAYQITLSSLVDQLSRSELGKDAQIGKLIAQLKAQQTQMVQASAHLEAPVAGNHAEEELKGQTRAQVAAMQKRINALTEQVINAESTLPQNDETAKTQLTVLKEENASLSNQVQQLKEELTQQQGLLKAEEANRKKAEQATEELQKKLDELENELQIVVDNLKKQVEANEILEQNNADLRRDYAQVNTTNQELRLEQHNLTEAKRRTEVELKQLKNEVGELKTQASTLTRNAGQHSALLQDILKSLDECDQSLTGMLPRVEPDSLDEELSGSIEGSLADEVAEVEQREKHIESADTNPEAVLGDIRQALGRIQQKVRQVKTSSPGSTKKLEGQLEAANDQVAELEKKLQQEQQARASAQTKVTTLDAQIEEYQANELELVEKLKELNYALLRLQQQAANKERAQQPHEGSFKDTQYAKDLEQEVKTLRAKIKKVEGDLDTARNEAKALKSDYRQAMEAKTSLKNRVTQLEAVNGELQTRNSELKNESIIALEYIETTNKSLNQSKNREQQLEKQVKTAEEISQLMVQEMTKFTAFLTLVNAGTTSFQEADIPVIHPEIPGAKALQDQINILAERHFSDSDSGSSSE